MALAPGTPLGPYSITALIGTGGMGQVYRAHDSRLGRDVAIKVAAEAFSERFTREARAIAALNHTNVCHLYDVGPNYLVMEFVEGESPRGPLAFEEALPILRQLIDGIEAAHEKGIVHRDLKPTNIKVTPDGVVKILDFGLAKLSGPAEAGHYSISGWPSSRVRLKPDTTYSRATIVVSGFSRTFVVSGFSRTWRSRPPCHFPPRRRA